AAGGPCVASRAEDQRQVAPGIAAGLARTRNSRGPPQLLSCHCIVTGNEADVLLVTAASRDSRDYFAAYNNRTRCVSVPQLRVGDLRIPHELARPRVHRDHVRIVRSR